MSALKRLGSVLSSLSLASAGKDKDGLPGAVLGHLNLGGVSLPVYETQDPERLPRDDLLLNHRDPRVSHMIWWCLQKTILEQDIFLLGSPGPFARRLALTYCALLNKPFEYVALHRDVGEGELKQSREIRKNASCGTTLEYVDSAAVRAVKNGSILILDGVEKTERGVLPLLNNLLENREINLEDGTHIVARDRYELMQKNGEDTTNFIPAHRDFRVIAIGVPVPPYSGFPLDPPFRSRFQVRYLDPIATSQILADQQQQQQQQQQQGSEKPESVQKLADAMTTIQVTREMRAKMASGVSLADEVPNFPQTSLSKWRKLNELFPPPHSEVMTPSQFANALLAVHPMLSYASSANWRAVESALESAAFGTEVADLSECDPSEVATQGDGIFGWRLVRIERVDTDKATAHFERGGGVERVSVPIACGPLPFAPYPLQSTDSFLLTPRFQYQLTALVQLHALGNFDIAVLPPSSSLQSSSSSTTILISTFASLLGYGEPETIHLYKEIGGRELWMRRIVHTGDDGQPRGTTSWAPAPLVQSAWKGRLVHLEGIDTIGATAGSLARLFNDREGELWEGKRIGGTVSEVNKAGEGSILSFAHPSFRVIVTASKATPPKEWLTEELAAMFVSLPTIAMPLDEERMVLLATGCPEHHVDTLETFARAYRRANAAPGSKTRRLGTAALVRVAKRLAKYPDESLHTLLNRTLLSEFLPATTKSELQGLLADCNITEPPNWFHPAPEVKDRQLIFPPASDLEGKTKSYEVALFDTSNDPMGASHVPFMNIFLDNSQQTALMRDIATDLEVLNEHVLLLGAQGVGKNKIIDRLLMLLKRPREYVQLHRDSTVQSLQYQTVLDGGVIRFIDSPMLRAIKLGRVLVIDEVDKAAAPVVASLASLAARGEMTLSDGRKVRPPGQRSEPGDLIVHPNFRLVLLANRPGFPFLGNAFLRVLGDTFSTYAVVNPDADSELRLLSQLAPDLSETLLRRLVLAFGDLRAAFDAGTLSYPFSLRELLAIVRHMRRFPDDSLEQVLRNVFDFDVTRPETLDALHAILRKHKLGVEKIGIDAVRDSDKLDESKTGKVIDFEPQGDQTMGDPKFGKTDNKQHKGGNTWAGGTGGRSTAGLGGRGGYMRLYKGGDINQVSDAVKANVPDEIKDKAREMARKALAERLAEIDMTTAQASAYSSFHDAVQSHVHQLVSFLDNLEANEEERVWLKRQSDGELDEHRLTEGLTGEASIYKRRGLDKPETGKPQVKPKRIRFIFDLSASMYRNMYDGRLTRSLEAATMIMESFSRLQRKDKYRVDLVGQSGEEAIIPLVAVDAMPTNEGDRYKVLQKMSVVPQYAWAGDHTVEAIEKSVQAVAETDSDDYFVICITDANFHRYGITAEDLKRAMQSNAKVKTSLVAIGEGAEVTWLPKVLPGKAYRVVNTGDIATTLRAILSSFLSAL